MKSFLIKKIFYWNTEAAEVNAPQLKDIHTTPTAISHLVSGFKFLGVITVALACVNWFREYTHSSFFNNILYSRQPSAPKTPLQPYEDIERHAPLCKPPEGKRKA